MRPDPLDHQGGRCRIELMPDPPRRPGQRPEQPGWYHDSVDRTCGNCGAWFREPPLAVDTSAKPPSHWKAWRCEMHMCYDCATATKAVRSGGLFGWIIEIHEPVTVDINTGVANGCEGAESGRSGGAGPSGLDDASRAGGRGPTAVQGTRRRKRRRVQAADGVAQREGPGEAGGGP